MSENSNALYPGLRRSYGIERAYASSSFVVFSNDWKDILLNLQFYTEANMAKWVLLIVFPE